MTSRPLTGPGHNGGPPLEDEHVPEWGRGGAFTYFAWKNARAEVWKKVPWETMIRRARKAEAIGLTYEEYTLELLERGRYLGPADTDRIDAIKAARPRPSLLTSCSAEGEPGASTMAARRTARGVATPEPLDPPTGTRPHSISNISKRAWSADRKPGMPGRARWPR